MSQYEFVLHNWTPARFKVGQMIGSSGILMGMAFAMYRNVDPDKKARYKSMYFSAALAVFLNRCNRTIGVHVHVCSCTIILPFIQSFRELHLRWQTFYHCGSIHLEISNC